MRYPVQYQFLHFNVVFQLRLEGNFLQNQSSSTRKTVEFVTERVASITIKHLVHTVIPAIKASAWVEIENLPVDNPVSN